MSSGPPDRGVGVVTPDDRSFLLGKAGFRRVLDTRTSDPVALARAALLLLEHSGNPVAAVSELPASAQASAAGANITPPSMHGDLLSYWSYYHKVGRPELARSDVNLKTFEVKQVRPGEGGDRSSRRPRR